MTEQDLISLGMFTQEIKQLQATYGFWLQNAEVFIPSQADPIAKIGAGGGSYCVQLLNYPMKITDGAITSAEISGFASTQERLGAK